VRPAAATTRTEPGRGEAIVLFTLDTELRRPQLTAAARELGLPELAVPRHIVPLDKLPLMGSGKVDYVRLKEMAEELRV
jgi:acyl-[acyl-carrier-protein]-phospholipid O-acyltransferase/long-chain-fatty-acid--[acyl-carrier-protein] ligase